MSVSEVNLINFLFPYKSKKSQSLIKSPNPGVCSKSTSASPGSVGFSGSIVHGPLSISSAGKASLGLEDGILSNQ